MEGDGGTIWTSPALDFSLKCFSQTTHPVFITPDSGKQLRCEVDGPVSHRRARIYLGSQRIVERARGHRPCVAGRVQSK